MTTSLCTDMLSVSQAGDTLAVGGLDGTGTHAEVLLFTRNGSAFATVPTQTLTLPTGMNTNMAALSADGTMLAATADVASPSVYVYARTGASVGTTPTQTLAPPAGSSEFFGGDGAVSGDGSILLVADIEGNAPGGKIYEYTRSGSSFGTSPSQILGAPAGVVSFGNAIALRPDAVELVESGDMPAHVTSYALGSTSFSASQMLTLPAGVPGNFFPTVALAADGTLFMGGNGSFYVYPPLR